MQREFDKMRVTLPLAADPDLSIEPPLPDDQDRILQAMFDLRVFVNDMTPEEIAEAAGLDVGTVAEALDALFWEKLVTANAFGGNAHLTPSGRRYVEAQRRRQHPQQGSTTIINHGSAQIAVGDGNSQRVTVGANVDGQLFVELAAAVRSLDLDQLDDEERSDLDADLEILEAQSRSGAVLPGVRRALKTVAAVAERAGVGTAARWIIENAEELRAALP